MGASRAKHTATSIATATKVLVVGGSSDRRAEIFDTNTLQFSFTGAAGIERWDHTATELNDGSVLVAGGYTPDGTGSSRLTASAELYDPSTGLFTALPNMVAARADHTATLLGNGRVLLIGGASDAPYSATTEIFDPATRQFTTGPALQHGRRSHAAYWLGSWAGERANSVLVTGGLGSEPLRSVEYVRP
jgi:hypothetical protein